METNSPNGSGKGTWRERLGIGGKELPKIAGEFSSKPGEPRMAPRPPISRGNQTVAKPAPMAPRPAPGARSPVAGGRPAITPQTGSDSLAERLRAQRAAAEKLAEQRVAAAKDRLPSAVNGSGRHGPEARTAERPKFSFADDQQPPPAAAPTPVAPPPAPPQAKRELPPPPRVSASPIVPPRPALGGDLPRPDAVRGKPNVPPYQPQFTPPPGPAGYRPLDPPGYQYQPRPPTRPYSPPAYGGTPNGEPRLAPPPARGGYRRPAEDEELYDDAPRRARGPARGRPSVAEDDLDEVFEDDAPPKARRRASAQDYGRAYREYEDEFGDTERRRSRGPFMVLAGLVALAALIGGGIWYYNSFYKARAGATASPGDVPVVTAPADPAKVDPPAPEAAQTGNDPAPAAKAKQFYDRILGEQAIEGEQMTPTEEAPIAPAPSPSGNAAPVPDPANAATVPLGDSVPAGGDPATEALPLPLPPPAGSDTQGGLPAPKTNASQTNVVPAAAPSADEALAPVPGEAAPPQIPATTATVDAPPAAPPQIETIDGPVADAAEPVEEIKPVVKKKVKKADTKKRPRKTEETVAANGADPIVLVPPGEAAAADPSVVTPDGDQPVVHVNDAQSGSFFGNTGKAKIRTSGKADDVIKPQAPNAKKNFKSGTPSAAPADTASEPQQVASIAEEAPIAEPAPSATGSTGRYVVQLGSFRTQDEARAEANRLKSRSAALSGVDTTVVRASVFGSSRYRVMTAPVADRAAGDRICEALLSANEPNCSVKQQ